MEELKPVKCGCGGEAYSLRQLYGTGRYLWTVRCEDCSTTTTVYRTEAEAIKAWNRAMGAARCCNTCDGYEDGQYCLLWSIFCPSDHLCKDWSENDRI